MSNTQAGFILGLAIWMLVATLFAVIVLIDDEELAEVRPHEHIVCTNCGCSSKE